MPLNPGSARYVLASPAYVFDMDVFDACRSCAMTGWRGFGEVAANICMMLWMQLLDC